MSETSTSGVGEPPCECPGPGFCPRYRINQDEYAYAVCANKPLPGRTVTLAKSEAYRMKWRVQIGRPAYRGTPGPTASRQNQTSPRQTSKGGPGTELKALFSSIGIEGFTGCACNSLARKMDKWGVDGCKLPENREYILARLRKNASKLGWGETLSAGTKLLARGVIINPVDPSSSLLVEAIRRSEVLTGTKGCCGEDRTTTTDSTDDRIGGNLLGTPTEQPRGDATQGKLGEGTRVNRQRLPAVPQLPSSLQRTSRNSGVPKGKAVKWAVGITTVPERRDVLLRRSLNSLARGGFSDVRIFVDGCDDPTLYSEFGKHITVRFPKVNAFNNWMLAAYELFYRHPDADRWAVFQDDILVCQNLRQYLEAIPFPENGYLNLSTIREQEDVVPGPKGIVEALIQSPKHSEKLPDGKTRQRGRGAMGLVFNQASMLAVIRHPHMTQRVLPEKRDPNRYFRFIDGAVVEVINSSGMREYVHNPGLLQHNGPQSTITPKVWGDGALARSWPGEDFDCLTLLPAKNSG